MTLGMASVLLGVVTVGLVGDGFLSGSTRLLPVVTDVASGTLFGPLPKEPAPVGAGGRRADLRPVPDGARPHHLRGR